MKVCQVISSIDKNSGGTSTYLQLLSHQLVNYIQLEIVTIKSDHPLGLDRKAKIYFAKQSLSFLNTISWKLKTYLFQIDADLYHGNGLWQYPVYAMCKVAKKRNTPYIISPHGMLEPWALNTRKWKKKLAFLIYQYNDIANASCIHATAQMEAENIRKLGFKNPIAVIPNGIDLSEFPFPIAKQPKEKRTLLFLSRIHPKKGIELLIEAWLKIDEAIRQKWQLEIAGNGTATYLASLQKLILSHSLEKEISIIGPQFGADKLSTYHRADLFVLPTYSENFGIVVAEALACGVPVITTKGTPWEELNSRNAGWWIDIGVELLIETLQQALTLSDFERENMGQNGRKLIEENYTIEAISEKMIDLYNYVLYKTKCPEFVTHFETIQYKTNINSSTKLIPDFCKVKVNVKHVITSIDVLSGGPSYSVTQLNNSINKSGFQSDIITFTTDRPIIHFGIENNIFSIKNNLLKYFNLNKLISYLIDSKEINILHGHGIWQFSIHLMTKIANRKHIPYLISPRGMLEPWALNTHSFKKKSALWLYQYNDLANATCIHATSQMEADAIRKLGFKNPIAIIPNGIDLDEFPLFVKIPKEEKRTVLFLSRIHIKKGIELLIKAWPNIDINVRQKWQVNIIGNGPANYIALLNKEIESKGLENEIRILGPQFGKDKLKSFQQADLFVLPTYSENFGIVVAEAMACGLPVITTKGTPWEVLNIHKAGWWIDINVESLVQALNQAMQLNDNERQIMGNNGRKLVEEIYSIESVSKKMIQLYNWALYKGEMPEFIYCNDHIL